MHSPALDARTSGRRQPHPTIQLDVMQVDRFSDCSNPRSNESVINGDAPGQRRGQVALFKFLVGFLRIVRFHDVQKKLPSIVPKAIFAGSAGQVPRDDTAFLGRKRSSFANRTVRWRPPGGSFVRG